MKKAIEMVIKLHRGKGNAIKTCDIIKALGGDPTDIKQKKYVKKTLLNLNIPIASCADGYYVILNRDELQEYIEFLELNIEKTQGVKSNVIINFEKYVKNLKEQYDDIFRFDEK
jgi:hypothetical protein